MKFNHITRRWAVKQARRLGIACTTAHVDIARGTRGEVVITNNGAEVASFPLPMLVERDAEGVKRELTCYDCGVILPAEYWSRYSDSREAPEGSRYRWIKVRLCGGCVKNADS